MRLVFIKGGLAENQGGLWVLRATFNSPWKLEIGALGTTSQPSLKSSSSSRLDTNSQYQVIKKPFHCILWRSFCMLTRHKRDKTANKQDIATTFTIGF